MSDDLQLLSQCTDPVTHTIALLGQLQMEGGKLSSAIIRIEKTALSASSVLDVLSNLKDVQLIEHTDIV